MIAQSKQVEEGGNAVSQAYIIKKDGLFIGYREGS